MLRFVIRGAVIAFLNDGRSQCKKTESSDILWGHRTDYITAIEDLVYEDSYILTPVLAVSDLNHIFVVENDPNADEEADRASLSKLVAMANV
jgi:hypothetical protein